MPATFVPLYLPETVGEESEVKGSTEGCSAGVWVGGCYQDIEGMMDGRTFYFYLFSAYLFILQKLQYIWLTQNLHVD